MDQDHQTRSSSSDKIKQLVLETMDFPGSNIRYIPFFYAEVKIDFNDVRTGFRSSIGLNKAIEIHRMSPDLVWAEDMILDIDPQKIKFPLPEREFSGRLPDFVDTGYMLQMENQLVHFLLRKYKTKVYRNFDLDTYSYAGESLTDFEARCLDLLDEPKRLELDAAHEVFNRRLEQIRQKYLNAAFSENLDRAKAESQDRDLFISYSDRIADFFLQPELIRNVAGNERTQPRNNRDLEERLASLDAEARQAIAKICDLYDQRAKSVDEYILHPNLKDIHFVRCCILWIPAEAT